MLTLTTGTDTVRAVGRDYDDDDDARWRGAALKYLATLDGRTYLVKPDLGWPSDSAVERVAAAFYRAIGVPTANIVRAEVDGTPACAVRVLENAYAIGEYLSGLDHVQALDLVRCTFGASLLSDGDKHPYNFLTDGARVYAIDHGLAMRGGTVKIPWNNRMMLTELVELGTVTWADIHAELDRIRDDAHTLANLAYKHAGKYGSELADNWKEILHDDLNDLANDPYGNDDDYDPTYDDDDDDVEPDDDNGHMVFMGVTAGWRTCFTRRPAGAATIRKQRADRRAALLRDHDVRRVHVEDCTVCRKQNAAWSCKCSFCIRRWRRKNAQCDTGRVFRHRAASDPIRRQP
jgi:hypothetical protein